MNRLQSVYGAVAALAIAMTMTGCPEGENPGNVICGLAYDPANGTVGDFGTDQAALQFETFLRATSDVYRASIQTEADILAACEGMAADLSIPEGELVAQPGELQVTATCARVAQEIDSILSADLPDGVGLGLAITPAVCTIDLELAASCAAECDLAIEGNAEVACDGALYGQCTGQCNGQCTFDGSAGCEGVCTARCDGTCAGRCTGACNGNCTVLDDNGNCVGECDGDCAGTCEGTCTGTCEGTCVVEVDGGCEGECRGGCDVEWEAECNGEANVTAEADCKAACDVVANANAVCTDPEVTVIGVDVADADAALRLAALVLALENNFPALLKAQAQVETALVPSIVAFNDSLEGSLEAAADLGTQAVACGVVALDAAVTALTSVMASVDVSVQVSVSASATGSVGAGT